MHEEVRGEPAAGKEPTAARPTVLVLAPSRSAVSGVSTHLNLLFASALAEQCNLLHFQVGSEGRSETAFTRALRFITSPFALALAILSRGVDIVHINTSLNARAYWRDIVYMAVARLCGARVIYQVHGGPIPQLFKRGAPPQAFLRLTLRMPEVIVVLGSNLLRAYNSLVPGKRVVLLPNAIDTRPYAELWTKPPESQQTLRLVYVGRLAREKGLHETLQGVKHARASGAKVELVIAGSGPDEPALRHSVQEMGLVPWVRFAGPTFGDDKIRLIASADALVLASYSEGLPYALLEAMAAGVPPIVTRVGAIPDVVTEGVHGLFVPARDPVAISHAIQQLAADRDLLGRMGAACRKRVSAAYSLERLAADFYQLYSGMRDPKRVAA